MKNYQHRDVSARHWFITGATGFIGRELVCKIAKTLHSDDQISVLVRSGRNLSASQRLANALGSLLPADLIGRINVITGDIAEPRFGLRKRDWKFLTSCTHIVHLAANTSFSASLKEARRINVRGVETVADLAADCQRAGNLRGWSHVSTAYVVGDRTDLVRDGDLDYGRRFRNPYEQTKNEAEQSLKPYLANFPLAIFRPSIVIGNSKTGDAGNFNTVYWGIRSYLSGQTRFYARPDTPLDLVPVDYVVDAMLALIANPKAVGKTLHLAGGKQTTVTLENFADRICRYFNSPMPVIVSPTRLKLFRGFIALAKFSARHRRFIEQAESYLPYFSQNPLFDTSLTESLLIDAGVKVPQLDSYLPRILDYCLQQSWGRESKIVGAGYQQRAIANG